MARGGTTNSISIGIALKIRLKNPPLLKPMTKKAKPSSTDAGASINITFPATAENTSTLVDKKDDIKATMQNMLIAADTVLSVTAQGPL